MARATRLRLQGQQVGANNIHSHDVWRAIEEHLSANPRPGEVYTWGGAAPKHLGARCHLAIEHSPGASSTGNYFYHARKGDHSVYISISRSLNPLPN